MPRVRHDVDLSRREQLAELVDDLEPDYRIRGTVRDEHRLTQCCQQVVVIDR